MRSDANNLLAACAISPLIIPPLYPIFLHSNRPGRPFRYMYTYISICVSSSLFLFLYLLYTNTRLHTVIEASSFVFPGKWYPILRDNWHSRLNFPSLPSKGTGEERYSFATSTTATATATSGNGVHTVAISRVKFTERCFAIQWKGIQFVGKGRQHRLLAPLNLSASFRGRFDVERTDSFEETALWTPSTRDSESKLRQRSTRVRVGVRGAGSASCRMRLWPLDDGLRKEVLWGWVSCLGKLISESKSIYFIFVTKFHRCANNWY